MSKIVKCGCGKHYVNTVNSVVWHDVVWRPDCALEHAAHTIDSLKNELAFHKKKKTLLDVLLRVAETLRCPVCGKQLGKGFKLVGESLYHPSCLCDVGGEG